MAAVPKDLPELLSVFQRQMDELFERLFSLEKKGFYGEQEMVPPVDCFETAEEFVVEIELPGLSREDISLGICRNFLVVEGLRREEKKGDTIRYICLERTFGRFCRTIEIPAMVDIAGVKARYLNGILTVYFPRIAETRSIIKDIPIE
jgi:HSP20 family protein